MLVLSLPFILDVLQIVQGINFVLWKRWLNFYLLDVIKWKVSISHPWFLSQISLFLLILILLEIIVFIMNILIRLWSLRVNYLLKFFLLTKLKRLISLVIISLIIKIPLLTPQLLSFVRIYFLRWFSFYLIPNFILAIAGFFCIRHLKSTSSIHSH